MEIVEYKNDLENAEYIENKIYKIRDKYVMLDNDLAILYGCKNGTKTINQAVKRHKERFPERFMFRLTNEEYMEILRSQTGTLELKMGQYSKYLPYAFTEQGVAMLATILKTDTATQISIKIMDAFIAMKKYIKNRNYSSRINNLETKCLEHDTKIKLLEASFNEFDKKKVINEIILMVKYMMLILRL